MSQFQSVVWHGDIHAFGKGQVQRCAVSVAGSGPPAHTHASGLPPEGHVIPHHRPGYLMWTWKHHHWLLW